MQTIKVTAEVKLPSIPNFLIMSDGKSLPIHAVTEDALREIGAAWTEALVEKAKQRSEVSHHE